MPRKRKPTASHAVLLPPNPAREVDVIHNDGTETLYIAYGDEAARPQLDTSRTIFLAKESIAIPAGKAAEVTEFHDVDGVVVGREVRVK